MQQENHIKNQEIMTWWYTPLVVVVFFLLFFLFLFVLGGGRSLAQGYLSSALKVSTPSNLCPEPRLESRTLSFPWRFSPLCSPHQTNLMEASHEPGATTLHLHLSGPPSLLPLTNLFEIKRQNLNGPRGRTDMVRPWPRRRGGEEEIMPQRWRRRLAGGEERGDKERWCWWWEEEEGQQGQESGENEGWMWKNRACTWIKRGWRWLHNYLNS